MFAVEKHELPEDFVSCDLFGVKSSPLYCAESADCVGSATAVGTRRYSVLQVYVLLS